MKFDPNNVKVFVGGIEMDMEATRQLWEIKTPRKWYKILEQNEDDFKVELLTNNHIASKTLDIKYLDKFLELEDSVDSPFSFTGKEGETL